MNRVMEKSYERIKYMVKLASVGITKEEGCIMEENGVDLEFNERFLQSIWNEQKIDGSLKTVGGLPLKIVTRGTWNCCSGPDFKNGEISLDGQLLRGNIEIHRRRSDWYKHGHDKDHRYDDVILHVVWKNDMPGIEEKIPTLELCNCMNGDWCKLLWELEDFKYRYFRKVHAGECSLRWAMTEDIGVRKLLEIAGMARFSSKTTHCVSEIEMKGENRTLVEAMFEVLGYKNNRKQFRQLAECLDLNNLGSNELSELEKEALIFGTANMLPDMTSQNITQNFYKYVNDLWDAWWRVGQETAMELKWDLSETRPYNRPWRRLAAAVEIMKGMNWKPSNWIRETVMSCRGNARQLLKSIELLNNKDSKFREYIDFDCLAHPAADLLGKDRVGDLSANALLPMIAAIGEVENKMDWTELARNAFMILPAGQGNRLTKEASVRFLTPPSRVKDLVKGACQQFGLIDIYKNFCMALDNDCELCPFSGNQRQSMYKIADAGMPDG